MTIDETFSIHKGMITLRALDFEREDAFVFAYLDPIKSRSRSINYVLDSAGVDLRKIMTIDNYNRRNRTCAKTPDCLEREFAVGCCVATALDLQFVLELLGDGLSASHVASSAQAHRDEMFASWFQSEGPVECRDAVDVDHAQPHFFGDCYQGLLR